MYDALDIANWFILKNNAEVVIHEVNNDDYEVYEAITHLKLQKLLYFAQGVCLALYDKKLFAQDIYAWTHGPVVPEVYKQFQVFKREALKVKLNEKSKEALRKIENNNEVNEVLNLVYDNFAIYTAWQLRQMTHEDNTPWDITEKSVGLNKTIPIELLKKYFLENVVE